MPDYQASDKLFEQSFNEVRTLTDIAKLYGDTQLIRPIHAATAVTLK